MGTWWWRRIGYWPIRVDSRRAALPECGEAGGAERARHCGARRRSRRRRWEVLPCEPSCRLCRRRSGGVDSSFGNNGTGQVNSFLPVGKVQLLDTLKLSSGGTLAAGLDAAAELVLVKFASDGTIDTTFGNQGFQVTSDLPSSFIPLNLAFNRANQMILLTGTSGTNGTPAVFRVTLSGEADGSFNGGNPIA